MSGKRYEVLLTEGAERDLEAVCAYIDRADGPANADYVPDRILKVAQTLAVFPQRGSYPPELVALGIRDFRQTSFKPYRVIYRVLADKVYILLIADGRRDMQSLLARRLLGA